MNAPQSNKQDRNLEQWKEGELSIHHLLRQKVRAWQDSNLQSPDPKSGALSIRPHAPVMLMVERQ